MPDFELTPDYHAVLAQWVNLNPAHPSPWFTNDEVAALTFHWPASTPRRAANGRFVKTR